MSSATKYKINKKINALWLFLKSNADYSLAAHDLINLKTAAYEDEWLDKIEEIGQKNPKPFASWFSEGKDRIYLPLEPVDLSKDITNMPFVEHMIIEALKASGCSNIDYIKGYCEYEGRSLKIGKLISKAIREISRYSDSISTGLNMDVYEADDVSAVSRYLAIHANQTQTYMPPWHIFDPKSVLEGLKNMQRQFSESSIRRSAKTDKLVVISQNPHDIAKASTERKGWRSCLRLPTREDPKPGQHYHSIMCEVESGGLIAYLINEDDKDIEKPLARVLIRRFVSPDGKSVALPENRIYGTAPKSFIDTVNDWVSKHSQLKPMQYYRLVGGYHSDTLTKEFLNIPGEILADRTEASKLLNSYIPYFEQEYCVNKSGFVAPVKCSDSIEEVAKTLTELNKNQGRGVYEIKKHTNSFIIDSRVREIIASLHNMVEKTRGNNLNHQTYATFITNIISVVYDISIHLIYSTPQNEVFDIFSKIPFKNHEYLEEEDINYIINNYQPDVGFGIRMYELWYSVKYNIDDMLIRQPAEYRNTIFADIISRAEKIVRKRDISKLLNNHHIQHILSRAEDPRIREPNSLNRYINEQLLAERAFIDIDSSYNDSRRTKASVEIIEKILSLYDERNIGHNSIQNVRHIAGQIDTDRIHDKLSESSESALKRWSINSIIQFIKNKNRILKVYQKYDLDGPKNDVPGDLTVSITGIMLDLAMFRYLIEARDNKHVVPYVYRIIMESIKEANISMPDKIDSLKQSLGELENSVNSLSDQTKHKSSVLAYIGMFMDILESI